MIQLYYNFKKLKKHFEKRSREEKGSRLEKSSQPALFHKDHAACLST